VSPRARRWLRAGLMLAGLVGLALAVRSTTADDGLRTAPSIPAIAIAVALLVPMTFAAGRIWVDLLGDERIDRLRVINALFESQLMKYLPAGGILQAAGQVSFTTDGGVTARRGTAALLVFAVLPVSAAATMTVGVAAIDGAPAWARVAALGGPAALVLTRRGVLARAVAVFGRRFARLPQADELPSQHAIDRALPWAFVDIACFAASFAVLLHDLDPTQSIPAGIAVAATAWWVGFLVVPLPSGLGVREAVIVALLPGAATGHLLAASLVQRLGMIGVEVAAVVVTRGARRVRSSRDAKAPIAGR
jgi:uncharacterized membrane protein YbhN (UPF0104 family)